HAGRSRHHRLGARRGGILRRGRLRRPRLSAFAGDGPVRQRVAAGRQVLARSLAVRPRPLRARQRRPPRQGARRRVIIGDVRLVLADIPVRRPHTMSFTTLEAVNFVFVRIETRDGLVGWGKAACLGGPTWSEESAESIAATLERYVIPWLRGRDARELEPLRLDMARRVQGNPFARAAVEMALWDLNGRAPGRGGCGACPRDPRGGRAPGAATRGCQSGLGSAGRAEGHPRDGALR